MLSSIITTSLFCCGFIIISDEGMILHAYRVWLKKVIRSDFWRKPFGTCAPCMASIFGTLVYLALNDFSLYGLVIHNIAAAGLSGAFMAFYDASLLINSVLDEDDNE